MARGTARLLRLAQQAAQANSRSITTNGKGLAAVQQAAGGSSTTNGAGGGASTSGASSLQQTRGAVRGKSHAPWNLPHVCTRAEGCLTYELARQMHVESPGFFPPVTGAGPPGHASRCSSTTQIAAPAAAHSA
jgi:hypothetical protein